MSNWFCPACGSRNIRKAIVSPGLYTFITERGFETMTFGERMETIHCRDCKRAIHIVQPLPETPA